MPASELPILLKAIALRGAKNKQQMTKAGSSFREEGQTEKQELKQMQEQMQMRGSFASLRMTAWNKHQQRMAAWNKQQQRMTAWNEQQ